MSMPRPPQVEVAVRNLSEALQKAEARPVDLLTESWGAIEKGVIKLLHGPFKPQEPEHQMIALGLAGVVGDRLHRDHQAFWFPYRETPEGASLGFPDALIMLAPFGAVIDALSVGKLERLDEVLKTIRTSLAQTKFGVASGQPMRLGPEDYMRLFDPGFVQVVGVDAAKLQQAWALTPERWAVDLRDAIQRAPRLPAEVKKQLEHQLVGAVQKLEPGKSLVSQAGRAPRVVETVGLLASATTSTGAAAEEFWHEMVMPLLFAGAPASFPPIDEEEIEAAKKGVDPLFLFVDVVPFQFKAPDEGLLGAFSELSVPAPEFRGIAQLRLIKVGADSIKDALAAFDAEKTKDAIKRFGDYLRTHGGVATASDTAGPEAKGMLDAAMMLLTDLKQAVAGGKELYVRRMTEAEAASEQALAQVRQALSAPRIILSS